MTFGDGKREGWREGGRERGMREGRKRLWQGGEGDWLCKNTPHATHPQKHCLCLHSLIAFEYVWRLPLTNLLVRCDPGVSWKILSGNKLTASKIQLTSENICHYSKTDTILQQLPKYYYYNYILNIKPELTEI